jgi:hypothetical protein
MLLRFLFGDDIFISYSRKDGADYAVTLALGAGRAREVSARAAKQAGNQKRQPKIE